MIDPAGYVVTAAHIARATHFGARVTTLDGVPHAARILRVDPEREMALLEMIMPGPLSAARPGSGVEVGQPVLVIGTPDNRAGVVAVGRVVTPRAEQGIRYGEYGYERPMRLDIDIEPGFSGGPVFDAQGRLQGMIIGFDLRRRGSGELVRTGRAHAIPVRALMATARAWMAAAGE